ncbi:MAG: hypothetical protein M5U27_17110 [Gaiella sp.]|nr:hypothetical protein [Gaiella sp.]
MRGRFNSSITRVRPVFTSLIERDPTGSVWLPVLLERCPRRERVPAPIRAEPGELLPELAETRRYKDKVLGEIDLLHCFERRVPPAADFLRWLILNSDKMTWPANAGTSEETLRRRRALCGNDPELRDAARVEALDLLDKRGAAGSDKKWWAFEGFTEVDCWLETERLVLLIEGKRRESLSPATAWYPDRNQLVRNLEVASGSVGTKEAFVLLVVEEAGPGLTRERLIASTPHMSDGNRELLTERYLGQVTWRSLVDALELPSNVLVDERPPDVV